MTFEDMQASPTGREYAENFLAQPIRTIVVRGWKDPAVLYQIFVRLNQGSLTLSPQELRQALYPSDFTRWVNFRSAESTMIHRARRIPKQDFRMRDAEMLLRFVAFAENLESYRGNLRKFLDDACVNGAKTWQLKGRVHYDSLALHCEETIERTFSVFTEQNSFLRYEEGSYNRRFNVAVYDLMMAVLGDPTLTQPELELHAGSIKDAFEQLCETDAAFANSVRTTTKSIGSTSGRIIKFGEALETIVGHPLSVVQRARVMIRSEPVSS